MSLANAAADQATWALALCDRIAAHTDRPGTVTRLFLSPRTRAVHALVAEEMRALGLEVRTDAIGNLRALRPAGRPRPSEPRLSEPRLSEAAPPVLLLGSHLDTVPDAGRFDGVLGVAAALAVLRLLGDTPLPFAVEVIAFSEEEGIRFRKPFLGSLALVGDLLPADRALTDPSGLTVDDAVRAFGLDPALLDAALPDAALTPGTVAFVELHIEQGPVLESLGLPLGVVTAIAGQSRLELTFTGSSNHAGTTPMPLRRDALLAAAHFVMAVAAHARSTPGLVATVGQLTVAPGAHNVVPGQAVCSLDVRHVEDAERLRGCDALLELAHGAAAAQGVSLGVQPSSEQAAVPMDAALCARLSDAATLAGCRPHSMVSGAGHDAMIVARRVPTAMLFVRTPGGLSHHPDEAVAHDDVAAALRTLHAFLLAFAPA